MKLCKIIKINILIRKEVKIINKKGFNNYTIKDNIVYIDLITRNNEIYQTLIDINDLQKLIELNLRWHINYAPNNGKLYVKATEYMGKVNNKYKNKTHYLHKLIISADYKNNQFINHINHNPLDNRKCNLEVVDIQRNDLHREKANKNTTSGIRNVSYNSKTNKWVIQFQVNKKNKVFKIFNYEELDKAKEYANVKRKEIYNE